MLEHSITDLHKAYKGIIKIYDKFQTIPEQIVHAHSELSEVYHCFQKPEKHNDPKKDTADELCDTILSCIAIAIKNEITPEELNERMSKIIVKNYEWATEMSRLLVKKE